MKTVKWLFLFTLVVVMSVMLFSNVFATEPAGADYSNEATTTAPDDNPTAHTALAGNVTYLDIDGVTTTQSWQGYYGNVTGTIQLADSADKVLYNWSVTSPSGEVYATENGSNLVDWASIDCFDLPTDHVALENWYNLSTHDADGVNETFLDSNTHAAFSTAGVPFTSGQCAAAYMYGSGGEGAAGTFEEVLLTDDTDTVQVIYASLLEKYGAAGFDGETYDFEMLVLEKGKNDLTSRNYYFYVELE